MDSIVKLKGPAVWSSYLINGDASGLQPGEQDLADAWLKREEVQEVVDVARGEDGEVIEASFTWSMDLYCPELGYRGADYMEYLVILKAPG